jgi:2-polyprenyl-3-methyl-5-hydroxy-6-metoxy-1,4-benzoquinol methylase
MDKFIQFYKEIGEKLPEEKLTYSFPNARIREKFIRNILRRYDFTILDLGCGEGRLTERFDVVGIDISIDKLIRAKRRNKKGLYICGDIENLNFLKGKFKMVLISEVIEHLRNPELFLKSVYNVVDDDGIIFITTPHRLKKGKNTLSIDTLRHFGIKEGLNGDEYIHRSFTKKEMEGMLRSAGFEVVEIGSIENEFRGIGKPLLLLKRLPKFYWLYAPRILDFLYNFMNDTGIIKIQKFIFKEGIRLYVIGKKLPHFPAY